ncbi:MAG TPA: KamA family radical SAM protein [Lentisphaeria bacterium]|nr:MAG: hypothetical protein A2X47_12560 [Lentisphaerae bacterium GWF2_38_69]HBM17240.1 KamA family radical SAM protein [Lentisphaeria bacterium]
MERLISNLKKVSEALGIELPQEIYEAEKHYPFLISSYYLNLIDKTQLSSDPIFLQSFPSEHELEQNELLSEDPQDEQKHSPLPKLIHRYRDRALILTTNRCSTFCRFCFRKRRWKKGIHKEDISDEELSKIASYLKTNNEIEEVLLSGGDPLMLSNARLKAILDVIVRIKNIKTVRIASRIPVTLPERITKTLSKLLGSYSNLWFVTHFNHPRELTSESMRACRVLTSAGIPMLNQTVLLKGINDSPEVLRILFRTLIENKIKPYYLFHIDPVCGVAHFSTGILKGLEIMRYFRKNLSGIATPQFAIDLPEGGGKINLQPSYSADNKFFESIEGGKIIKYAD